MYAVLASAGAQLLKTVPGAKLVPHRKVEATSRPDTRRL
jgi:hypothetical protein